MTSDTFDPQAFWDERLRRNPTLRGTGHRAFDLEYNRWLYRAQHDCIDDLLRRNSALFPGARLLDIGSGTGFFAEYFLSQGAQVDGLDIAPSSVDYLKEHIPQGNFYAADISTSTLPVTGPYDLISLISVLYHIVDDVRWEKALTNVAGLLKSGGYVVLTDILGQGALPTAGHTRYRQLDQYSPMLHKLGIQILEIVPMYFYLNRSFIPWIGPRLISALKLGETFYRWDSSRRLTGQSNGSGMKMLLGRKVG